MAKGVSNFTRIKVYRGSLDLRAHLDTLQRLAQTPPRAAQAIVTFTERAAARVRDRARA